MLMPKLSRIISTSDKTILALLAVPASDALLKAIIEFENSVDDSVIQNMVSSPEFIWIQKADQN